MMPSIKPQKPFQEVRDNLIAKKLVTPASAPVAEKVCVACEQTFDVLADRESYTLRCPSCEYRNRNYS